MLVRFSIIREGRKYLHKPLLDAIGLHESLHSRRVADAGKRLELEIFLHGQVSCVSHIVS